MDGVKFGAQHIKVFFIPQYGLFSLPLLARIFNTKQSFIQTLLDDGRRSG